MLQRDRSIQELAQVLMRLSARRRAVQAFLSVERALHYVADVSTEEQIRSAREAIDASLWSTLGGSALRDSDAIYESLVQSCEPETDRAFPVIEAIASAIALSCRVSPAEWTAEHGLGVAEHVDATIVAWRRQGTRDRAELGTELALAYDSPPVLRERRRSLIDARHLLGATETQSELDVARTLSIGVDDVVVGARAPPSAWLPWRGRV